MSDFLINREMLHSPRLVHHTTDEFQEIEVEVYKEWNPAMRTPTIDTYRVTAMFGCEASIPSEDRDRREHALDEAHRRFIMGLYGPALRHLDKIRRAISRGSRRDAMAAVNALEDQITGRE